MALRDLSNVIFDLGGVLLRWDTAAIVATVFADQPTRAAVHAAVFAHPDWLELDRGTLTEEAAVQRFAARSGQPVAAMRDLMEAVRRELAPQKPAVELLLELHAAGVPLFCLSNMHARNVAYLTSRHGFFRCFRAAVYSARVQLIKPEPAIYAHAAEQFGLQPSACVFVDDAPANVTAAREAGWRALRYTSAATCREELLTLARTAAA